MSQNNNYVTLYSNGLGHFRRSYLVPAGSQKKINIPFQRDHIADALESIQVFGNVRYDMPPSYTPVNSDTTSLRIDQAEPLVSLLTGLSGSQIEVKSEGVNTQGRLMGLQKLEIGSKVGESQCKTYVILQTNLGAIRQIDVESLSGLSFLEEAVQSEISKALKANYEKIKPDSTFIDLSLSCLDVEGENTEQEASVQYKIPVAAWKMRYSIRRDSGKFFLEGTAIIDNNTTEDWNNFVVSVVTGNPISFSTDLAQVKVPHRQHVSVVDGQVLGHVQVQESMNYAAPRGGHMRTAAAVCSMGARSYQSVQNTVDFGMDADTAGEMYQEIAAAPGVDSKEVGDFCIFTSKEPITILSKRSAVVPMFVVPLTTAGSVLLYKETNHARRPYRAVKFKNETSYSLNKGKVVVYEDGVYQGECVMEVTKPNDNRMLPYCLENGVKIVKTSRDPDQRQFSIKLASGIGVEEEVWTACTEYSIENKKDEEFNLMIEHVNALGNAILKYTFEGAEIADQEKLDNGVRASLVLPANKKLSFVVKETWLRQTQLNMANFQWFQSNIVNTEHPLAKDRGVQACASIQEELEENQERQTKLKTRREELDQQARRIRENIGATKGESASTIRNDWIKNLDMTENEIQLIDTGSLPDLKKQHKEIKNRLNKAVQELTVSWQVEPAKAVSK